MKPVKNSVNSVWVRTSMVGDYVSNSVWLFVWDSRNSVWRNSVGISVNLYEALCME